ncbi:MAG TPA: hypothetical protein PLB48_03055 [Treponema sp.]|nr:hypothetical protein [Treponema sp.]HRU28458.1 hypothetical protein [Treponema sp.]
MKIMLVSLLLFTFANTIVFAEESDFSDVFGQILDEKTTSEITGGDLILAVNRNAQTMTVYNGTPAGIVNGTAQKYTVPITTKVVKASSNQNKNDMTRERPVPNEEPGSYFPTQLPTGTYKLDSSKSNVAGYGPGIHIDAKVDTKVIRNKNDYYIDKKNDFFVHSINVDNTWGCIGVKNNNMGKVMNSYNNSYGPKILTIDSYH